MAANDVIEFPVGRVPVTFLTATQMRQFVSDPLGEAPAEDIDGTPCDPATAMYFDILYPPQGFNLNPIQQGAQLAATGVNPTAHSWTIANTACTFASADLLQPHLFVVWLVYNPPSGNTEYRAYGSIFIPFTGSRVTPKAQKKAKSAKKANKKPGLLKPAS